MRAHPVLAAVVVEPEVARSAPAANSEGAVVELVMEGMTIRAGQVVDEAHPVRVIRAACMAAR
ncbi:hypothetical protein RSWS8N_01740 [Cereibacter sphaeroides WS8N]|nr:hypothetical protein RSWS8N_01740 [Cereibacter sphaeroides WS8N]